MGAIARLALPVLLAASPAAASTTTLQGNGVAVTLDLEGFKKDLDPLIDSVRVADAPSKP